MSIIIPCYNAEELINKAIQSALEQTWPWKEIIVVDDGSSDNSLDVIKSFGQKVYWISCSNQGGNFARNKGLELARGEWIQFLDADDWLEPSKIENQMKAIQKMESDCSQECAVSTKFPKMVQTVEKLALPYDVVYSPVRVEEWSGESKRYYVSDVDTESDIETQWIKWQLAQTGSVLWRRAALVEIGGWNETFSCCQDNEVIMRAIMKGLTFCYSPKAEAVYRHWSESTVCRKDPRDVIYTKTELLVNFLNWLREANKLNNDHLCAAGQACFEMSRTLAAKVSLSESVSYYKQQKELGLIYPAGDAYPKRYEVIYKLMGFRIAEWVSMLQRKKIGCISIFDKL